MLIFLYIILLKGKKKYNHNSQPGKSLEGKEGCSWWLKTTGDLSQSTPGTLPYSNMSPTKMNQIFKGTKRIVKGISLFPSILPLHSRITAIMPFCIVSFFHLLYVTFCCASDHVSTIQPKKHVYDIF